MFNAILWPVDGTPLSMSPLSTVIKLARTSRATVVLVSIAEPRLYWGRDADAIETGKQVEAIHVAAAARDIEKVRAAVEQAGITCRDTVTVSALPSAAIVKTAQQQGCDLIVMATRGKMGMIESMFDPSCTQEVIASSPVPVLVVP